MTSDEVRDVLAQPTRARLFALLGDLKRPVSTAELSRQLEKHPNGIRTHLDRMAGVGLVRREQERRERGRPRDLWTIDPAGAPAEDAPTAYAELSQWLARAVESGAVDGKGLERFGRKIGCGLADHDDDSTDPETRFQSALAEMGFQPDRQQGGGGQVIFCLNNCPYRKTAKHQQSLICGLHRGITVGLLESIAPEARLDRFVAKDPELAGCQIAVSQLPTAGPV